MGTRRLVTGAVRSRSRRPTGRKASAGARSASGPFFENARDRERAHAREPMTSEALIAKLLRIEALHAGATTDGERIASEEARKRILERLAKLEQEPIEMQFTLNSPWSRQLFIALARRYGLAPYRHRRQRGTTLMLKIKRRFLDETFWPQFKALDDELGKHLDEVAKTVIEAAVHRDLSEAQEHAEPKQLAMPIS